MQHEKMHEDKIAITYNQETKELEKRLMIYKKNYMKVTDEEGNIIRTRHGTVICKPQNFASNNIDFIYFIYIKSRTVFHFPVFFPVP